MVEKEQPLTLWLTGISGAGKTTLAKELKKRLEELGRRAEIVDGDAMRASIGRHLGFSKKDRTTNILRGGANLQGLEFQGGFCNSRAHFPLRISKESC